MPTTKRGTILVLKEGVDGLEVVKGQVDVHEVVLHPSQVHEGDV